MWQWQKQIKVSLSIKLFVSHRFTISTLYIAWYRFRYIQYVCVYELVINIMNLLLSGVCLRVLVSCFSQAWSLKLEQEEEKNKALTEALQTLATEHYELQQSLYQSRRSSTLSTLTEDDFYDALSGQQVLTKQFVLFLLWSLCC